MHTFLQHFAIVNCRALQGSVLMKPGPRESIAKEDFTSSFREFKTRKPFPSRELTLVVKDFYANVFNAHEQESFSRSQELGAGCI